MISQRYFEKIRHKGPPKRQFVSRHTVFETMQDRYDDVRRMLVGEMGKRETWDEWHRRVRALQMMALGLAGVSCETGEA